ncbi:MAG: hypothetical protein MUC88_25835 [Planctomycetes bacterium]|jgi:uncharacterized paraquat-inducible protein A|nr:hypothetical protein [Planctomycetota bacterium]
MMVKCDECGNVYSDPPRAAGERCNVLRCPGTLHQYVRPSFLQCSGCGNIFGSPPYQAGDLCRMPRCGGTLRARR